MATSKLSEFIRQERTQHDNLERKRDEDRLNREKAAKIAAEKKAKKLQRQIIIVISSIVGPFILAGLIAVGNGHSFESGVIMLFSILKWIIIVLVVLLVIGLISK